MARTFKRQPFSVSTSSGSYARPQTFIQGDFKGLSDVKNDVTVDQMTFASVENVYVNDDMLLVSRPPFKFYNGEGYIERQWQFGQYTLKLYKDYKNVDGNKVRYTLTVTGKDIIKTKEWIISRSDASDDICTCIPIEDKIFVWFGNIDFCVFNTQKKEFEPGDKYLYVPILSLSTNGIETPIESKNFLTSTYRKRYQYSSVSGVNFESFLDKELDVRANSKLVYTKKIESPNPILIYPTVDIAQTYHMDIVQGLETTVYLRYSEITKRIEISFDGAYYQPLPTLANIVGLPQLTKDAMYVVAFTNTGIAWCKLFADTANEFIGVYTWQETKHSEIDDDVINPINTDVPVGCFLSKDEYVYIRRYTTQTLEQTRMYTRWLDQNGDAGWNFTNLLGTDYHEFVDGILTCSHHNNSFWVGLFAREFQGEKFAYDLLRFSGSGLIQPAPTYQTKNIFAAGGMPKTGDIPMSLRRCDIKIEWTELLVNTGYLRIVFPLKSVDGSLADYTIRHLIVSGGLKQLGQGTLMSDNGSAWFKISACTSVFGDAINGVDYITSNYSHYLIREEAWPELTDEETAINNGDILVIKGSDNEWKGNIHKVLIDTTNTYAKISLVNTPIEYGDYVLWRPYSMYSDEYLSLSDDNRLYLFKVQGGGYITTASGRVHTGERIKLVAYHQRLKLSANTETIIWAYPGAPENWRPGDVWPSNWSTELYPKPYIYTGTSLPSGPVSFEGYASKETQIRPLMMYEDEVWLNINGKLWTSQLDTKYILELDEYVDTTENRGTMINKIRPLHHSALNEHCLSFVVNGKHLLEVTQTKRDEETLDFLLYLPARNEQVFTEKITNMHPIADNILSVFTEHAIWNITASILDDGSIVYSAPVVSKIPAGCRDGDDVITALDGQALLLATSRGIAALAPQDFVATTDNVITYLSDSIQERYHHFYTDNVMHVFKEDGYKSQIKMLTYRYWLLLYRFMDRTILMLDTRTGAWWKWSTPYPIKQIIVNLHLYIIMQIDYLDGQSLNGVSYVLKDTEDIILSEMANTDFQLPMNIKSREGYKDDVVERTSNGSYTEVKDNNFIGSRKIKEHASSIIDWHFMSQKLHFNQINNYKAIRGITTVLEGTDSMQAVLSTRVYRNLYHPEQNDIIEMPINEIKTFTHRLNLMHAMNFQYKFENDKNRDGQIPLRLSSLSIKYEIKEGIR